MQRLLLAGLLLAGMAGASAAELTVELRDAAGKPVEDGVAWLEPTTADGSVKPATGSIRQVDREFVPTVSVVPQGSAINFPNEDTMLHHVYSFSPAKTFEIQLYKGKPAAPVVFDKPGVVSVGCNIHDWMEAFIVVVPSRWYGKSGPAGSIPLADLPADSFKLHVWHPRLMAPEPAHPLALAATDRQKLRLTLRLKPPEPKVKPAETTY
jgi:plastocyanin